MSGLRAQVNGPNILTALRIVLVPLFGWMLLAHPDDVQWRIFTTLMFSVAIATDFVDGWWARKYNLVTDFGKIADPIADKAITGMAFVGLSIIGELPWLITICILVREWGITLFRFILLRRGVVLAASRGGKLKTVLQSVALILFLLPLVPYGWAVPSLAEIPDLVSWIIMILATLQTVITGVQYVVDNLKE
ncbi:CDP-diacylglycerol--glycerol-3-phosphate 3-phosphatidyltransferase [Propioniferax innocua]|uniref:CDP-diacylglycerol--glycerol-3-phosphate 3-phosphatidyltransferase n=1 Tax=Propioniferax innocua TaxID=1753 RepID=A0A542Z7I8_9ACTN|nr:CDP-diacylglycerol--glycerol-3-phosphate 3-phosphatidyltransferase [Propioniferax innocua]TQL56289.1 CDP-diacylglycerol--glycerol-3-phosphate 3-phosphatidyltransferase [Propioniferax innocua]